MKNQSNCTEKNIIKFWLDKQQTKNKPRWPDLIIRICHSSVCDHNNNNNKDWFALLLVYFRVIYITLEVKSSSGRKRQTSGTMAALHLTHITQFLITSSSVGPAHRRDLHKIKLGWLYKCWLHYSHSEGAAVCRVWVFTGECLGKYSI